MKVFIGRYGYENAIYEKMYEIKSFTYLRFFKPVKEEKLSEENGKIQT